EGEGEGEGEGELDTLAEALLDIFVGADIDADGRLSFAEASASLNALTLARFNALDTNGDGFLSESELEARLPAPVPGCALFTDGLAKSAGAAASEIFLLGVALLTLLGMSTVRRH